MITKLKKVLTANRIAWISCAAATTVTAGVVAFVAASVPKDYSDIATVETDTITEEVTVTERQISHDVEFLTADELKLAHQKSETEAPEETEAVTETETEAAAYEAATELPEENEDAYEAEIEAEIEADEDEADEAEDDAEEEETEAIAPAANAEETEDSEEENVIKPRDASNGTEDENELSSALDMEFEDDAEGSEETAPETEEPETLEITEEESKPLADDGFVDPYFILLQEKTASKTKTRAAKPSGTPASEPEQNIFRKDGTDPETVPHISRLDIPSWLTLDENGIPKGFKKVLTGKACAYTAEPDALMSTGKPVFQGYVAVDPDIIPYGTELYIIAEDGEVYGYAIAADTGGSVRRGVIIVDLFMDEYDDCIQWGNKPVNVYVLSE